jgi:citrate lyase gamma subunit
VAGLRSRFNNFLLGVNMDIDSILNDAAESPKKSSKKQIPTKKVDDCVADAILGFKTAKKDESAAKSTSALLAEKHLIPVAQEFHKEVSSSINLPTTVKLTTEEGDSVQVDVAKCQYSDISIENEPELKKRFGEDYEDFFKKNLKISLTDAAIADKSILATLIKAVGQEKFKEYFSVSHVLKPTEAFHRARFIGRRVPTAEKVIEEGLVKPYKPAVRG